MEEEDIEEKDGEYEKTHKRLLHWLLFLKK